MKGWSYYLPDRWEPDHTEAITEHDYVKRCRVECDIEDADYAAKLAAKHYDDLHDGWDATWPIEFVVIHPNGSRSRFSVEKEAMPVFRARKVKGEAGVEEGRGYGRSMQV